MWPLVGIPDYNKNNLLSDHIIAVYPLSYGLCGAIFFSDFIPDQFFHITVTMVYCCLFLSFFIYYFWMSATNCWDHWFCRKYFYERSYYRYISLFHSRPLLAWLHVVILFKDLFQHNGAISKLPLYIGCFCLLFFPSYVWLRLLVGITDVTGSTFLSDHVIAIYQYFLRDPYRLDFVASHSLAIFPE